MLVDCQKLVILDTDFGFLGLVFQASKVLHLSLGHTSRSHVLRAIVDCPNLDGSASVCREADLQNRAILHLVGQLYRYTEGEEQEFRGAHLDLTGRSPFARRVTAACRKIPYGQTASYGTLARRVGSPHGARSVGTVMAKNRFPLLVPCHRVVAAGNRLGGFSAAGGVPLKRRLLEMEAAARGNGVALGV
jgi:O-6-methylguanine DNA methyltransferase